MPITVNLEDNDLSDPMDLTLNIYDTVGPTQITSLTKEDLTEASYTFNWNGSGASGPGTYTYEVEVSQLDVNGPGLEVWDSATYRSQYLNILRATDESGEPIYDAEYYGYDDNGTPDDETDDDYLYLIRRYVLKDGLDTDASAGNLWLYDPGVNRVATWDVAALQCLEHGGAADGLGANSQGIRHSLLVPVAVDLMQNEGTYLFVLHMRDDHSDKYRDHRQRWALNLNQRWWIRPDKVRVYYRNRTDPGRAYPFSTDSVAVRAIVWAETAQGYYAYCGMRFDPDSSGNWFDNDGYWYDTGRSGDPVPGGDWQTHQWPRLDAQTTVRRWPGLNVQFSWYRLQSEVDNEDTLTTPKTWHEPWGDSTRAHRYFWYPPYAGAQISGWGTNLLALNPGSDRYVACVRWNGPSGEQVLRSLTPTPGPWAAKATDQDDAVWTRTWSQNCDEPPDTVGPEEYAVRISVRDAAINETWQPDIRKRTYLQWLTSFLDIPYEWGGHWYGGRADAYENVTYVHGGNEGYGIDCSGFVCAGARWAGYNWNPWPTNTTGLQGGYYSTAINGPNANLRPGDILNKAGEHVVTVYRYTPGHWNEPDSYIIDSCATRERVDIHENVRIKQHYLDQGYSARELVWHGQ